MKRRLVSFALVSCFAGLLVVSPASADDGGGEVGAHDLVAVHLQQPVARCAHRRGGMEPAALHQHPRAPAAHPGSGRTSRRRP